ncbi:ATP-binding protein [Segeticoccus rhizosphaerae]|uniref:ATP-binding protein n=1 Tax=Segeticoccus rhizosphaerae TaxID=1104777 RepID=UPI001EE4E735|nr:MULTISPECIES: ATP-binding protein [Intrasporangiaceae]
MPTPYEPLGRSTRGPDAERPQLRRPVRGRVVAGVCIGLADHLGVPVKQVRIGCVIASFVAGAGLLAYAFLWALTPEGESTAARGGPPAERTRRPGSVSRPTSGLVPGGQGRSAEAAGGSGRFDTEAGRNLLIGAVLVLIGIGVFAQSRGVNLRLGILVPLLAIGVGAVLAWSRLDDADRDRWIFGGREREGLTRLVFGIALASVGVVALATQGRGLAGLWDVGLAAIAVLVGAAFIAAPWVIRLWNGLREEQTERIRETERADIAAHLHDSVLQTLALIQRKAEDPAEVARLARAQERELRGWLYAGPRGSEASLASAVTEVSHEVEDLHGTPIELVVTGDRALDEPGTALVRALREALLNAVRHGAPPVSAYVEVGNTSVDAFVRDHGPGFDLEAVPEDRLGVRESILGRMTRQGGTARWRRLETGTEVTLALPVAQPGAPPDGGASSPEPAARHTDSSVSATHPTRGELT